MVVEQQDSGVCLSTEPGSPSSDAPVELRSSVREEGSTQRVRLSRLVDGLERLRASYREMEEGDGGGVGRGVGGGKAVEASGEGEKELQVETEERVSRLAETIPDLSEGKGEKNEEGRNENERRMESDGRGTTGVMRCHHHLLMTSDDNDDENEARFCQICRKKEERMRALRRAIGDDQLDREEDSSMASPWSPSSSSSSAGLALVANHLHHHQEEPRSPSAESPSSTAGSDHSSFDQLSSPSSSVPSLVTPKQSTPKEGRMNGQQHQQPPHRLALPGPRRSSASHSPSGGQSITGHSGQSSPRVSGQQQQALIQKLQGALAKMTPRMFKSTKAEPRPWSAIGTTQDQKILALMLAKKEAEERQRSLREMAHDQWEEEMMMKKEMMTKKAAATTKETTTNSTNSNNRGSSMRRRRNTGGDGAMVRQKDKLPTETNCDEVGGAGSEPQTPCSAHGTSHPTSPSEDRDRERGVGAENLDKGQHTPAKSRPDKPQQQKSREKQNQAIERKKLVEQRLEQQRREMEEHLVQLKRKQEQDLQRANSVRMSKEQKQILRAKLKNLEAQQKQERISQLKRQSMVDLSQKQEEIQSRLSKAELKVQQLRHDEARKKREDLERKIEQSRLRQEQIETEQKQWQEELLKYQKWKDYQADGLAKETVTKKKEAACVERIQREKLQRENMKRLLNQEEQWLNDVEATIAMKDARIRTVQKEKEEQIQRSRAMASVSQRMREELKLHYSMNDLDQVTRQVVLENRLVSKGPQNGGGASRLMSPPSHNASSLTLGCVDEV